MTPEEKAQLAKILPVRAELAGKTFSTPAIIQMVEDMSDLNFFEVMSVLKNWGRTEKTFPYPSDIREKVLPEINADDDAVDCANLIISAIGSCGYTNPGRAREKIGELGWAVVDRMGGWKHLCETLSLENETTYRAQIRSYVLTVRKRALRDELDEVPALPTSRSQEVKNIVTFAMKSLPTGDE